MGIGRKHKRQTRSGLRKTRRAVAKAKLHPKKQPLFKRPSKGFNAKSGAYSEFPKPEQQDENDAVQAVGAVYQFTYDENKPPILFANSDRVLAGEGSGSGFESRRATRAIDGFTREEVRQIGPQVIDYVQASKEEGQEQDVLVKVTYKECIAECGNGLKEEEFFVRVNTRNLITVSPNRGFRIEKHRGSYDVLEGTWGEIDVRVACPRGFEKTRDSERIHQYKSAFKLDSESKQPIYNQSQEVQEPAQEQGTSLEESIVQPTGIEDPHNYEPQEPVRDEKPRRSILRRLGWRGKGF